MRDLALEARQRHAPQQVVWEHLDDNAPAERRLHGDEHTRHAAAAQLALERVRVAERCLQLVAEVRHQLGRTRLRNLAPVPEWG